MDVFCCDALHVLASDARRATDAEDYHDTGEVTCMSSCLGGVSNCQIARSFRHYHTAFSVRNGTLRIDIFLHGQTPTQDAAKRQKCNGEKLAKIAALW